MADRDSRRSAARPGGRSPRRDARPGRSTRRDGSGASQPRTVAGAVNDVVTEGAALVGRRGRRRGGEKKERTFLGLSTGKAVVLAVVICALALTLAVPLRTYISQRGDAAQVAAERVALEQRVAELQIRKDQTDDPAYITAQARERLGYVMPGETPYQVQLPGARARSDVENDPPPPPPGPWYSDLWSTATTPR
ncbi:septum formation initiator family protein [Rhodococcus sp. BP-349]|jgi:cell division protein FtsB|uniref:FtsB family cell division protein n=1 Tax=unclassified Rhodococcus (in: high G+C Gram-positive bacteria) TaxID=192944 RepID=UPI001C9B482E|nr:MULTISPECIES: septum formation initiator family protein [unclassified Rhodococcus (in: high G+C Gram-positive bacteria)]MBY6538416.1 septum formation initiator family protein [Rhodococcus sp. BP-363]MBY6542753.1 septum formation initiator family protein [Rhodococcus sp. BP-369]MBY6561983.1 septum formation initiator family protein [Rhodococcus sp. BP-370]MBY6576275.1 septum formation initiator family protein [Rhodococcus sp. BP-364]MBY6585576.1 septum formation initiator family protein [Rho